MIARAQFRPQALADTSSLPTTIRYLNSRLQNVAQSLTSFPAHALERGVVNTGYDVGHVKRYGATGTGDDATAATRFALAALQVVPGYNALVFDPGSYVLSDEVLGISDINVVMWGATIASATRFRSYLCFTGCTNVQVFGGTLDLGQSVLPTYTEYDTIYNVGLFLFGADNVRVVLTTFRNLYTRSIYALNCTGYLKVVGCVFTSPAQLQGLMAEHISIVSSSCDVVIDDFIADNARPSQAAYGVCALAFSGTTGAVRINNYYLNYCGRSPELLHPLQAITFYKDSVNVIITNGRSKNTLCGFLRLQDTARVDVSVFDIDHADNANVGEPVFSVQSFGNGFGIPGAQSGCQSIRIHNGTMRDDYSSTRDGFYAGSYDWAVPLTDVEFSDVDCININRPAVLAGPYKRLTVGPLHVSGTHSGNVSYTIDPGGVPVTAVHGVTEASSVCADLTINRITQDLDNSATTPITLDFTSSHAYTGTIKNINLEEPTARTAAPSAPFLIYRGIAGQGRLTITDADVDTFTSGFNVANVSELTVVQNAIRNVPAANFLVTSGTIGVLRRHGNRLSAGPDSGTATLTAGTVTVATAEVQTGDRIILNHATAGGALGQLSYTIVTGVSFTITSTNAGDTSTVAWMIDH